MSLSREEAAQTLRDVTSTERHSADLARYRHSAPFFYWWGFYWLSAYSATALWPWRAWFIWTIAAVIGIAGHIVIAQRVGRGKGDWRWGVGFAILFGFAAGTIAMMQLSLPLGLRLGAFTPLLAGTVYAMAGLLFGLRIMITGLFVMAATLVGVFLLPHVFALWMAGVGGGALILTGFWLQRA